MLKVSNVKVYNLEESLIASGNAMRTTPWDGNNKMRELAKGLDRCKKLTKAGFSDVSCHSNYLTGILVSFDVTYPQYWTPEAQRYHWFNIVTSASKMHRLCKMNLKESCTKYVDPRLIEIEQEHIDDYNRLHNDLTLDAFYYVDKSSNIVTVNENREEALYRAFMVMLSNCPLGFELFEHVTTNYKQLQTIYQQRKHHRLKEDWGPFCQMIENLPYASELIMGKE